MTWLMNLSCSMSTVPILLSALATVYFGWSVKLCSALLCRDVKLGRQSLLYFFVRLEAVLQIFQTVFDFGFCWWCYPVWVFDVELRYEVVLSLESIK